MPSDNEVLKVVTAWSGTRPEKMSQSLGDWWDQTAPGSTHKALKFDPDGIDDLLLRLKSAFPASPRPSEGDFRAGGGIKTMQDLSDALQPVLAIKTLAASAASAKKKAAKKKAGKVARKAAPPGKVASKKAPAKKASGPLRKAKANRKSASRKKER